MYWPLHFAARYKFCFLLYHVFGLLRILGFFWSSFSFGVFLAKHWFPLNVLRLPDSVCSGCLSVMNSLSKPYFSFSQFYIAEVDFITQKAPVESSNQKRHRQKVKGISEETFLCHHRKKWKQCFISLTHWYLYQSLCIINSTHRFVEFRCFLLKERSIALYGNQAIATVQLRVTGTFQFWEPTVAGFLKKRVFLCAACDREVL